MEIDSEFLHSLLNSLSNGIPSKKEVGLSGTFIVPVSSYIEWNHEDPESLSPEECAEIVVEFDGRYNIDKLVYFLEENIDFRAVVYLMLNNKLEDAKKEEQLQ